MQLSKGPPFNRLKFATSLCPCEGGFKQTDRQKAINMSPPYNMHRWAQKLALKYKAKAEFFFTTKSHSFYERDSTVMSR